MKKSEESLLLLVHLRELFPKWRIEPEFRFYPARRWKFDFALFALGKPRIAVEIDGGAWVNGRHNRASGWLKDKDKFNVASALGWRVLHFTPQEVLSGAARSFLANWFMEGDQFEAASDGLPALVV